MIKTTPTKKRLLLFIFFGWALLILGDRVGDLELYQGSFVATYALAITSIILLTGYSGQLSLGHSALMAVGAYTGALSIFNAGLHPVIGLINIFAKKFCMDFCRDHFKNFETVFAYFNSLGQELFRNV